MAAAKIVEIEAEMARTQKNKATAKHLGVLKAKLSKLRAEVNGIGTKGAGGKPGDGFDVTKSGDTRVGLVGFPSVGKSTLLTKLTGTASEAAAYEFTTLTAIPGTLMYRGAKIQIVDLPGIIEGAKDGKGRGRQVIGTARTCNLILIVIDATKPLTHKHIITRELEGFGIRLNKQEPNITIRKTDKGGVTHRSDGEQNHLDAETIRAICSEYKMSNCDVNIRYANATIEDLIDVLSTRTMYIPALFVLNKIDAISIQELELYSQVPHYVPLSATDEWNFDELLTKIWDRCEMTRIYTKPKGQIPDFASPVILHNKAPTVKEFCDRIHKTMINQFKYAWVWGRSVKHQPQRVGASHVLDDEDVIQIVKK